MFSPLLSSLLSSLATDTTQAAIDDFLTQQLSSRSASSDGVQGTRRTDASRPAVLTRPLPRRPPSPPPPPLPSKQP